MADQQPGRYRLKGHCPECDFEFDALEQDEGNIITLAIFNDEYHTIQGHRLTCPNCAVVFGIEIVEKQLPPPPGMNFIWPQRS